jgi:hypothetical protein
MKTGDIPRHRLHNQRLTGTPLKEPAEVVRMQGAVQAQDYAGAKWAVALRLRQAVDEDLDRAFNQGSILRTHLLRPTWHFVTPEDIRWMLELTAPRVHALNAGMYRQAGLDKDILKKSKVVIRKALQDEEPLTRKEIAGALEKSGIRTAGDFRLTYIVMHAELEGLICSGGRRGRQFTYALLDERAPLGASLAPKNALAELTRRYFASHGPATPQDFTVWSGLTLADARAGLEANASDLEHARIDGREYWFPRVKPPSVPSPTVHLLPNYDEYFIGFKDRSTISGRTQVLTVDTAASESVLFSHVIFVDGKVAGGWRRTVNRKTVMLEFTPLIPLTKAGISAIEKEGERFGRFLGLQAEPVWRKPPSAG